MPFVLKNSECTFQRVVYEVLRDLPYLFVFIDDIPGEIYTYLRENNLTVNMEKCVIACPTVTFLGHMVDSEGICPIPEKVSAIRQFPQPMSKLDVQRLLGICNFYHSLLSRLAHIVGPLTDSLSVSKKEFTVTKEMIIAINKVKDATLLVHPIRDAVISITTDASDTAIACILHQHH